MRVPLQEAAGQMGCANRQETVWMLSEQQMPFRQVVSLPASFFKTGR